MTRIAHLTTVHSAFDVRIVRKECVSLAASGYDVALIVPHQGDNLILNGVRIHAVPKAKTRFRRITATVSQVFRAALDEKADFYHFHDPELIPVGLLLKVLGKHVVYDVHENVPEDVLNKTYLPSFLLPAVARLMGLLEYFGSAIFDGIVTATPIISKRFPPKKTVTVQNFPIPGELLPVKSVPYAERPPLLVYVGGISAVRGLEEMIRAMALIPKKTEAQLLLAGTCSPPNLEQLSKQLPGCDRAEFLGWQSRDNVAALLGRARAGIVTYHPVPGSLEAQPTKLFEYMSVGIPVIASDFLLWREIVGGTGCGLLVDPHDPKAIGDAITWVLGHPEEAEAMGRRGKEAIEKCYNWEKEAEKLVTFYKILFEGCKGGAKFSDAFYQEQNRVKR